VVLEVQPPLVPLLSGLKGIERIIAMGDPLPDFDLHCPLMSLPLAFGTTLSTIPSATPYLHTQPDAVPSWQARLSGLHGLRVGLAWAGNPIYPSDSRRSLPLDDLAPLGKMPGISFVSLQKGPAARQLASLPPDMIVHDWTDELHHFADTAALVQALDLVIGVDTAVIHLAGALGKPVWLLNRFDTCWRWMLGRDDSPWYPTLRQFRQPTPGDWATVAANVRTALEHLTA
jgi:hypothetical protein